MKSRGLIGRNISLEWMFEDDKLTMIITTKDILEQKKPILSVWRDEEDGMWQFLSSSDVDEDEAKIISLEEIVNLDNSLNEIADLKLGWVAWRQSQNEKWARQLQE